MLTVPNEREQERRPLIARRDSVVSDTSTSKDAPLPIVQLVLICLWRATNVRNSASCDRSLLIF